MRAAKGRIAGQLVRAAVLTGMLCGWASATWAQTAVGEPGGVKVSIGAGTQRLYLPDVAFTQKSDINGQTLKTLESNDLDDALGYALAGDIVIPLHGTIFNSMALTGSYGALGAVDRRSCGGDAAGNGCTWANPVDGPGPSKTLLPYTLKADRDVALWNAGVEGRRIVDASRNSYWGIGVDARALNQTLRIDGTSSGAGTAFAYRETLDARYYGATVAFGSDYSLPFFSGLTSGWGLQSSFRLWGGLYFADAQMDGRFNQTGVQAQASRQSLSADGVSFIGGLTTQTSKQIAPNMVLSLQSDYTFLSWAPYVTYDDADAGGAPNFTQGRYRDTSIKTDHALSMRTMLRLTVDSGAVAPLK